MSKSIMLVICDFLLLSLLSLANFDDSMIEDQAAKDQKEIAIEQAFTDSQMLDLLKMSLDNERQRREALNADVENLSKAAQASQEQAEKQRKALESRERELRMLAKTKQELENERSKILEQSKSLEARVSKSEEKNLALQSQILATSTKLEKSAQERIELERKLGDMRQADSSSKLKLETVQEELRKNKESLEHLQKESDNLKNENKAIEIEKRALATQLEIASTKTQIYEENLKRAQALVDIEKTEKEKIRETIAVGVTEIASNQKEMVSSQKELAKDVRDLRPKTPSEVFELLKSNFVKIVFNYKRTGLLGTSDKSIDIRALPISINSKTWLIFSADDTILEPSANSKYYPPESLSVTVMGTSYRFSPNTISSLNEDPRLLAIPVPSEFIEKEKLTPIIPAENFFSHTDCIIINPLNFHYGQVPFRADFKNSAYAQMDVGLLQSVFGSFAPSSGDIVVSRAGEFLGFMAYGDLAILMRSFLPINTLKLGDKYTPAEAQKFVNDTSSRLKAMPLRLK